MFSKVASFVTLAWPVFTVPAAASEDVGMPAPGPARILRQAAIPSEYLGACPATLRFVATIEKGGWGTVEYYWQRSDGSQTEKQRLEYDVFAPPQTVTMTWQVAATTGQTFSAHVVITEPPRTMNNSEPAVATVRCTNRSTTDACAEIERSGPIGSLVRECADQRYRTAQETLNRTLGEFLRSLGRPGETEPAADDVDGKADAKRREYFREAQAAWEMYRGETCEEAYYEFWPGSMAATVRLDCLTELTRDRADYLRKRLDTQDVN
jgi:uncharacterized protein YecT (DUF1311 family)